MWISLPFDLNNQEGRRTLHEIPTSSAASMQTLQDYIHTLTLLPPAEQRLLTAGGEPLPLSTFLNERNDNIFYLHLRLLGGKGGFGANLKRIGAKMAQRRDNHYESCRDLNGRRLRTLNEAKRLADAHLKRGEAEASRQLRLEKKIQAGLAIDQRGDTSKRVRLDPAWVEQQEEQVEQVKEAVQQVLAVDVHVVGKAKETQPDPLKVDWSQWFVSS